MDCNTKYLLFQPDVEEPEVDAEAEALEELLDWLIPVEDKRLTADEDVVKREDEDEVDEEDEDGLIAFPIRDPDPVEEDPCCTGSLKDFFIK